MTTIIQVSGKPRAKTIHVPAHSRQKAARFTELTIQTASQMREELRFDRECVLAVDVALAQEFPGELK